MASTHMSKATNPLQLLMATSPGKLAKSGSEDALTIEFSDELTSLKGSKAKSTGKKILPLSESLAGGSGHGAQVDTDGLPKAQDTTSNRPDSPTQSLTRKSLPRPPATRNASTPGVFTERGAGTSPHTDHQATVTTNATNATNAAVTDTHPQTATNDKRAEPGQALLQSNQGNQRGAARRLSAWPSTHRATNQPRSDDSTESQAATKLAGNKASRQNLNNRQPAAPLSAAKTIHTSTLDRPATALPEQGQIPSASGTTLPTEQGLQHQGNARQATPTSRHPVNTNPAIQHAGASGQTPGKAGGRDGTTTRQTALPRDPASGNPVLPTAGTAAAHRGVTSAAPAQVSTGTDSPGHVRQADLSNAGVTRAQQTKRSALAQRTDADWSAATRAVEPGQQPAPAAAPASMPGSNNALGQVVSSAGSLPPSTAAIQQSGNDFSVPGEMLEPMDAGLGQPEFSEQLVDRLSVMLRGPIGQASIRLSPEELGPVRIELNVEGQQASLRISAAHPETRAALDATLDDLREHFSQEGLELRDARVQDEQHNPEHSDSSRRGMQQHPEPGYASAASRDEPSADDSSSSKPAVHSAVHRPTDGRINLIA